MSRQQVIRVSAINVTAHPHPVGVYERLIRFAQKKRLVGKVHGDRYGLITQVWESVDSRVPGIHGVISTFVNINLNEPWLDLKTSDEASEEELNRIELPENLRPNMRRCSFVLDSSTHLLIFDVDASKGGISPKLMLGFLDAIFSKAAIQSEFGSIELSVIKAERSVEAMFKLPKIREIFIHATRPNAGDFDASPYKNLKKWLDDQNACAIDQGITSPNQELNPNEDTRALASVAEENGYVIVRGTNPHGEAVKLSSKDNAPLIEQESFNPEVVDLISALHILAQRISEIVRGRRKGL